MDRRARRHRRHHLCVESWITVTVLDASKSDRQRFTRPGRGVVGAVTRVGGLERETPRHVRRLRERRRVRDPGGARGTGSTMPPRGAAQEPFVNHENVTVPVGTGKPAGPSPWPGRAPSCPPAPTSPASVASWITVAVASASSMTGQRFTRPRRTVVGAVSPIGGLEHETPRHARRQRERRRRPRHRPPG